MVIPNSASLRVRLPGSLQSVTETSATAARNDQRTNPNPRDRASLNGTLLILFLDGSMRRSAWLTGSSRCRCIVVIADPRPKSCLSSVRRASCSGRQLLASPSLSGQCGAILRILAFTWRSANDESSASDPCRPLWSCQMSEQSFCYLGSLKAGLGQGSSLSSNFITQLSGCATQKFGIKQKIGNVCWI